MYIFDTVSIIYTFLTLRQDLVFHCIIVHINQVFALTTLIATRPPGFRAKAWEEVFHVKRFTDTQEYPQDISAVQGLLEGRL